MPRDFRLLVFSWISFPQAPEYTIRAVSNFSKFHGNIRSSRCITGVNNTSGTGRKIYRRLIPVVHLDLRISPQIFKKIQNDPNVIFRGLEKGDSWKKTWSKKSRDSVPLSWYRRQFCRRCHWYRWQICHRCCWYRWCTLTCEFSKKFEKTLKLFSGA
jgi:hypothetical protein